MARAVNDLSRDAFFYLRHRSFASDIWTDCRIRSAGLKVSEPPETKGPPEGGLSADLIGTED